MKKLYVKRENGITWIVINRPEKHNAIDFDVMNQLTIVLDEIEESKDDKLVVIRGAGNESFCSGGDLSIFHQLNTKEEAYQMLSNMAGILYRLFFFRKPTFAALNGTAVGGGCELATACDFRIAVPSAKIGFIQGGLGITTGWGGSTMLFHRLKQSDSMEMLMTTKRYSSEEAKTIGFVNHIIKQENFEEGCKEWLSAFIKQSGPVLNAYKKRWCDSIDKVMFKKQLEKELLECSILWATDEHHELVRKFLAKKKER